MATEKEETTAGLGTFRGVYRPTVLTILGLMMYVREGWMVGQAGLLGAVIIILTTFVITGATALSLSSITTNIHIGAGGVFSIISKSLGLETGGSIGIPLYLGQALSGALYIYGFTEGWLYLFPGHSQWLVAYGIFLVAMAAVVISSKFAFRLQGVVMFVILLSLTSIILGVTDFGGHPIRSPQLWGTFEDASFWTLFAIFFPGGTGIMVGASMSGALDDPRRSIPRGTLWAVGTALVVYLGMAVWYSVMASPEELQANRLIVIERAAVSELVLAGLLASTFTAAISTIVASPQVLHALAEQKIVPRSQWLSQRTDNGDPRNATFVSALLIALTLLLGSLDAVAVLITMFFLLIYLTINVAIAIEQGLGLISFRPIFSIPRWIPVLGVVSCTFALFVINPVFALVALAISLGIYMYLVRRRLETPWQTVRSGIFVSLADWAFKRVARALDEPNERSWKPDLLVPVTSREQLDGIFRFLRLLAEPKGSIKIVGVLPDGQTETDDRAIRAHGLDRLDRVTKVFHAEQLLATSTVIEASSLLHGVRMSASVLRGSAFRPNILFGMAHRYDQETLQGYVKVAEEHEMGVALLFEHPEASLGQERRINIWITDQSPDWNLGLRLPNLDLSILLGLQIYRKWQGKVRLMTVCGEEDEVPEAGVYHQRLIEDARLPTDTQSIVMHGQFREKVTEAPESDLNIFGLAHRVDKHLLEEIVRKTRSTCLFVRDSGRESALA
jgi:amino acid transporter